MKAVSTQEWIDNARSAYRDIEVSPPGKVRVPTAADFPAVPETRSGLRGLEETQDIQKVEAKGIIINRYA